MMCRRRICPVLVTAIGDGSVPAMTSLRDRELWACALEVERQHGASAPVFVAARIGALALAGDSVGVETWRAIAGRLDKLARNPPD